MSNHNEKIRILTAVKNNYPQLSQKQIKKLIEDKMVWVNDRPAKKNIWVEASDKIKVSEELATELAANKNLNCELLLKNKDFIFLNKAAGVHSVALNFSDTDTVANWLLTIDPKLNSVSSALESGLLHRLDCETSGVMVAARNKVAFEHLKKMFQNHQIHKEYTCVVSQIPPQSAVYEAYAGQRSKNSPKILIYDFLTVDQPDFKKISTEILTTEKLANGHYLVTVKLITGYRHQIRAHLAYLGCPIVGDQLYGGIEAPRLMLHASQLEFDGVDGKSVKVETPADFS